MAPVITVDSIKYSIYSIEVIYSDILTSMEFDIALLFAFLIVIPSEKCGYAYAEVSYNYFSQIYACCHGYVISPSTS